MKEQLNKKQTISLVIGILTILLLIFGASYAYFSVSVGNNSGTTTITGDIGGDTLGTVTLAGGNTELYLGISAYDMSETNKGKVYYSSTTEGSRETSVANAGKTTYTATLSGDDTDEVMYACDYEFTVTSSGTVLGQKSINDIELVFNGDINKVVNLTGTDKVSGTWYGFKKSNAEREFNAYLQLKNTNSNQNDLAGKNLSVEIKNTKWKCYLSEADQLVGEAYALGTIQMETDCWEYEDEDGNWIEECEEYEFGSPKLIFLRSETPFKVGEMYDGQKIIGVYTGFESETYEATIKSDMVKSSSVPWYGDVYEEIIFKDKIRPISTAYWFASVGDGKLNLEQLDLSLVKNMSYMFYNIQTQFEGIENLNVSNVTDMSYMFAESSFDTLNLSNWDVSSLKDMNSIFWESEFDTVNLSNWDVSNAEDISYLLTYSEFNMVNLSGWKVSNIKSAFNGIDTSGTVNVSNWNTSNVTDMSHVFGGSNFTVVGLADWDTSNVLNMEGMFSYAEFLNGKDDISGWNTSKVTDMSYMFEMAGWGLDLSGWDVSNVTNMERMFGESGVPNISGWDVSNVTNMSEMFNWSSYIPSYISSWDVSSVTDMSGMFSYASIDTELDLSQWDVSNVTDMSNMFANDVDNTNKLNINLSNWNVSNVTNMSSMFEYAIINGDIKIGNWNVSNVTFMSDMFYGATINVNINLSNWNVSKVTNHNSFHEEISGSGTLIPPNWT